MEKRHFESSPSYGFIKREYNRFNDLKLFKGKQYLFSILKKIKLWYGTIGEADDHLLVTKAVLAVECTYKILDGKEVKSQRYGGLIKANDIDTKEKELQKGDYFTNFSVCFDDIITYIKFESFMGQTIEIGDCDPNTLKVINFNKVHGPHVIQILHGFYDNKGIRALGFRHVARINMFVANLMYILRIRHKIKTNEKEKEHWSDENNLKKLDNGMKAIVKCCFLPDAPFSIVFKYCLG